MPAPTCVACSKPLKKRTSSLFFADPDSSRTGTGNLVKAIVTTKAEAQRHTNQEVVSVRKHNDGRIWCAGIWDGISYGPPALDGIFCTNNCAQAFGLAVAERMIADGRIRR